MEFPTSIGDGVGGADGVVYVSAGDDDGAVKHHLNIVKRKPGIDVHSKVNPQLWVFSSPIRLHAAHIEVHTTLFVVMLNYTNTVFR